MAINFNDRVLVTNPTTHYLGRFVGAAGIIEFAIGIVTQFTPTDLFLPPLAWCALGVPTLVVGIIFMRNGLTKN
jgi:hypothetical protein